MLLRAFAERFAQGRDVDGQVLFLDNGVGPDAVEQRPFVENLAAAFDQRQQRLEGLGSQRHRLARAPEQPLYGIQPESAELINSLCCLSHKSFAASRLTKSSKILPQSGRTFYQPLRQSRSRCGDKNGSRKKRRRDEKKKNRDYGRNPPAGLAARAAARRPLLRHLPTAFAADRPRASR